MKKNCSKILFSLSVVIFLSALAILPAIVFAAWSNPTQSPPPAGNAPALINIGTDAQTKAGNFSIYRDGLTERYGIGTSSPIRTTAIKGDLFVKGTGEFTDYVILRTPPTNGLHAVNRDYVLGQIGTTTWRYRSGSQDIYNINTGNVGIGTTNPATILGFGGSSFGTKTMISGAGSAGSSLLQLTENSAYSAGTDKISGLFFGAIDSAGSVHAAASILGVSNFTVGQAGTGYLAFRTKGTFNIDDSPANVERMRITSTGNVGIGTTNPGEPLTIVKTSDDNPALEFLRRTTNDAYLDWRAIGTGGRLRFDVRGTTGSYVNGALVMEASNDGSNPLIGIGTTDPDSLFQVYSSASNYLRLHPITANRMVLRNFSYLDLSSSDANGVNITANSLIDSSSNYNRGSVTYNSARLVINGGNSNPTDGAFLFYTALPAANPISWGNSKMTIIANGNVGIGMLNPDHRLTIENNGDSNTGVLGINVTGSGAWKWASAAIAPSLASGNNLISMIGQAEGTRNCGYMGFNYQGAGSNNNFLTFGLFGVDNVLNITGAGNVGIGTAAPARLLHVVTPYAKTDVTRRLISSFGSNNASEWFGLTIDMTGAAALANRSIGLQTADENVANGGNLALQPLGGNVGIGTTDPGAYRLNVVGDAKISGKLELGGADVAEEFITDKIYPAGTVLVMGEAGYKSAKACASEYDQKVLGVVSDNASVIMGRVEGEKKAIVAMIGVVKVKVNNSGGAIAKGDLLTTSETKGEARRADEPKIGAIIGKALEDFGGARGEIMVLVNLK